MWPVMTLTLLLQLTDEEQLFAANAAPVVQPQGQVEELVATAMKETDQDTCAPWPQAVREDC